MNVRYFLVSIPLLFVLSLLSCASPVKKQYPKVKGEFMTVDEDRDVDLLRIEDISSGEGRPGGGCPT